MSSPTLAERQCRAINSNAYQLRLLLMSDQPHSASLIIKMNHRQHQSDWYSVQSQKASPIEFAENSFPMKAAAKMLFVSKGVSFFLFCIFVSFASFQNKEPVQLNDKFKNHLGKLNVLVFHAETL